MNLNQVKTLIENEVSQAKEEIEKVENNKDLLNLRAKIFSKETQIGSFLSQIGKIEDLNERKNAGIFINQKKQEIQEKIQEKMIELEEDEIALKIQQEKKDASIPVNYEKNQLLLPITKIFDEMFEIMSSLGFTFVNGNHIEDEYHNFDALNISRFHPARNMMATFFLKRNFLLRTHTSHVQIRWMRENRPPQKIFTIGSVFRNDSDKTHTPMFHQMEGLVISETANMCEMINIIERIIKLVFFKNKIEIRLRPSYFPFTEPSAEIDIKIDKDSPWLEIMGCGIVHPNVLQNINIDHKKYSGYAWGMGLDRIAMLKFGIHDLREMFKNDLRWIQNFGFDPNYQSIFDGEAK